MKKVIKESKIKKKKFGKSFTIVLSLFAVIGIVSAAYLLFFASSPSGLVISSTMPVSFTESMSVVAVDTTNQSATKYDFVKINNINGPVDLGYSIQSEIIDVNDSCSNVGDVNISVVLHPQGDASNGTSIFDGNVITIPSDSVFVVNVSTQVVRAACPQSVESTIELIGV